MKSTDFRKLVQIEGHAFQTRRASRRRRSLKLTIIFQKVREGYIGFVNELPRANTQTLAQSNFWLAERFAAATLDLLRQNRLTAAQVDLIGSHGQTCWHQPPSMAMAPACAATDSASGSWPGPAMTTLGSCQQSRR